MSKITEVNEIRAKLGTSLREAMDAYIKFGSAEAAIKALGTPEAMSAWQGPYEELAKERRLTDAAIKVATLLYVQANPGVSEHQARERVGNLVRIEQNRARGLQT